MRLAAQPFYSQSVALMPPADQYLVVPVHRVDRAVERAETARSP